MTIVWIGPPHNDFFLVMRRTLGTPEFTLRKSRPILNRRLGQTNLNGALASN